MHMSRPDARQSRAVERKYRNMVIRERERDGTFSTEIPRRKEISYSSLFVDSTLELGEREQERNRERERNPFWRSRSRRNEVTSGRGGGVDIRPQALLPSSGLIYPSWPLLDLASPDALSSTCSVHVLFYPAALLYLPLLYLPHPSISTPFIYSIYTLFLFSASCSFISTPFLYSVSTPFLYLPCSSTIYPVPLSGSSTVSTPFLYIYPVSLPVYLYPVPLLHLPHSLLYVYLYIYPFFLGNNPSSNSRLQDGGPGPFWPQRL